MIMTAKPLRGRPARPEPERLRNVSVRLNARQHAILVSIGVTKLRAWLDQQANARVIENARAAIAKETGNAAP